MQTKRNRLLALALLGAAALVTGLSACQTVKGAGQDIQNVGEAGERAISGDNDSTNK